MSLCKRQTAEETEVVFALVKKKQLSRQFLKEQWNKQKQKRGYGDKTAAEWLQAACEGEHLFIVREIAENETLSDQDLFKAMKIAAKYGNYAIMEVLRRSGAKFESVDRQQSIAWEQSRQGTST